MLHIDFEVNAERLRDANIEGKQLRVVIAATHTDMPINNRIYTKNEVKKQLHTWTQPYNVPILVHHNEVSDAVGRVQEQMYVDHENIRTVQNRLGLNPSQILPQDASGVVLVIGYITDEEQIRKILTGIYKTVSVGFTCDELICSICGKRMRAFGAHSEDEDGCTHIPGEEYDGQIAYQIPIGIRYQEVSFVNIPADQYAGIVDFELVSADEAQKFIVGDTQKTQDENVNLSLQDRARGGINVEEINKLENEHRELLQKYEDAVNQLEQLKTAYEKLQDAYNALASRLRDSLVEKVVFLKSIIIGADDDATLNSLKDHYNKYSTEELAILEKEFVTIVEAMLDCEDCDEESQSEVQSEVKSEPEIDNVQTAKDDTKAVVKDANPQRLETVDINRVLNKILGK